MYIKLTTERIWIKKKKLRLGYISNTYRSCWEQTGDEIPLQISHAWYTTDIKKSFTNEHVIRACKVSFWQNSLSSTFNSGFRKNLWRLLYVSEKPQSSTPVQRVGELTVKVTAPPLKVTKCWHRRCLLKPSVNISLEFPACFCGASVPVNKLLL